MIRNPSPGSITATVMTMNRLHMSIESLPPKSTELSLDTIMHVSAKGVTSCYRIVRRSRPFPPARGGGRVGYA